MANVGTPLDVGDETEESQRRSLPRASKLLPTLAR